MLNKDLIIQLQNPNGIDLNSVKALEELSIRFPFSSVFQLLFVKGLHNIGDSSFDAQLQKTSIVLPQREVLYHLLYSTKIQAFIDKVELESEKEESLPVIKVIESTEEIIDSKSEVSTFEKIEEETIITPIETIDLVDYNAELQENILLEAINTTIQLDVAEYAKQDILENIEEKELVSENVEPREAFATPLRFSDWLLSMKSVNEEEVKKENKLPPLISSQDLIDKFISTQSKRIDVTKEPLTTKELGKLSLVENEDFVTETLASIYAKQGKYSKAIKIYQQLILNFPEKSVFFASRIRFLKEKMEYDNN